MKYDEKKCPHCQHPTIDWDICCPGCDKVPWKTPEGRRVRVTQFVETSVRRLIIAAMIFIVLIMLAKGALRFNEQHASSMQAHIGQAMERVAYFESSLRMASLKDEPVRSVHAQAQDWMSREIPMLLQMMRDNSDSAEIQTHLARLFRAMFGSESHLRKAFPEYHQRSLESIRELLRDAEVKAKDPEYRQRLSELLEQIQ